MQSELWDYLGNPKYVCAPMVDASELAFRSLCDDFGCHIGYTPMVHSGLAVRDKGYVQEALRENFCEELDAANSVYVDGVFDLWQGTCAHPRIVCDV
jgi:tRNA-dihydrouridine synthase